MPNPLFAVYIASARRRPELWRLLAGAALIVAIYALAIAGLFGGVAALHGAEAAFGLAQRLTQPQTPASALLLLATFAGLAAAPMAAARLLHARGPGTLFGRAPRVLRDFVVAAATVGALFGIALAAWGALWEAEAGLDPARWLALLPLTLLALLLQTGAEELVFRGYLMQQLAARFRSRAVWMLVPALLFGLVHLDPATAGPNAWIVVAAAMLFGLAAADLTVATGSLGAAWGFHFANNFLALGLLATEGTITGLALYTTPYTVDADGPMKWVLAADLALILVAWALCRRILRR